MQRFQVSWLAEILLNNLYEQEPDFEWFFPWTYNFVPMEWLSQHNLKVTTNIPVNSQAIVARSWFLKSDIFPKEDILTAFNQILMNKIGININPFRNWLDTYFTLTQLDYLFYWHEAANELKAMEAKDVFLALVSQVMRYWLANNGENVETILKPDEVLALYYHKYKSFREHYGDFHIIEQPIAQLEPIKCSTVIFPLAFSEEDYLADKTSLLYNAWVNGHTNIEEAKLIFSREYKQTVVDLGNIKNLELFKRLSENARSAVFIWSGKGMTPLYFQRFLVDPLLDLMSKNYTKSKFVYKCVDASCEEYDYILLCF